MTVSEYLWKVYTWNDSHPEGTPMHVNDMTIAMAMVNDTIPGNTGYEMEMKVRGFHGLHYFDLVEAKKQADGDFEKWDAIVTPMYEEYLKQLAEYEASKG